MSEISDVCPKIHGSVVPYILKDGKEELLPAQSNMILRGGNDAVAHLLAGDVRYAPQAVIFCGSDTADPASDISYDDSYDNLVDGFIKRSSAIMTRQTYDEGGDISVAFTATTATGAGYPSDSLDGKYVKRAILCYKFNGEWVPFSAVNLGTIVQLPAGAYFGIHWNISISGN